MIQVQRISPNARQTASCMETLGCWYLRLGPETDTSGCEYTEMQIYYIFCNGSKLGDIEINGVNNCNEKK